MRIWEETSITAGSGGFDAEYTAMSIHELEQQLERGEIETSTYLQKKQALVRLYLKATTSPKRRRRPEERE